MHKLILVLIFFILLLISTPILHNYIPSHIILLPLLLIFSRISFEKENKILVLWVVWAIFALFLYFIGHSEANIGNILDDLVFFLIPIIYIKFNNTIKFIKIQNLIDIVFSINYIYNIVALLVVPNFLDLYNFTNPDVFKSLNLSNTDFIIVGFFHSIISAYRILLYNNFKKFTIISFFSSSIYVLLSGKATFIILLIFSLFFLLTKSRVFFKKKYYKYYLVVTPLLFFGGLNLINSSERFLNRYNSLLNFDYDSMYFERINLNVMSLKTFIENPFLGIGHDFIEIKGDLDKVYDLGIGLHSELIDWLPRYGIVGLFFLITFYLLLKNNSNYIRNPIFKLTLNIFIITSIFSNTFFLGAGVMLFMYAPLVFQNDLNYVP